MKSWQKLLPTTPPPPAMQGPLSDDTAYRDPYDPLLHHPPSTNTPRESHFPPYRRKEVGRGDCPSSPSNPQSRPLLRTFVLFTCIIISLLYPPSVQSYVLKPSPQIPPSSKTSTSLSLNSNSDSSSSELKASLQTDLTTSDASDLSYKKISASAEPFKYLGYETGSYSPEVNSGSSTGETVMSVLRVAESG